MTILPLSLVAQRKRPLLHSISSDTVKGKYQQIIFAYLPDNRVDKIIYTRGKTQKKSPRDPFPLVDTFKIESFVYKGKSKNPVARKITSYLFDPVEQASFWQTIFYHDFVYQGGKHVQDNITIKDNRLLLSEDDPDNDQPWYWRGSIERSNASVKYLLNRNTQPRLGDSPNGNTLTLLFNKQKNIQEQVTDNWKGNRYGGFSKFELTAYDSSINPLHDLNITEILPYDKIELSFDQNELNTEEEKFDGGGTTFLWHFLNPNNVKGFAIIRFETDSPFKDLVQLNYTYNSAQQPVVCSAVITKVFASDGHFAGRYSKRFTFQYKK